MLTQHIALVPETYGVNPSELARVSAALQKQVTRDLAPFWGVTATVDAFPKLEDVPVGYWPIVLSFKRLGPRAGVHLDRNGAPYAQIEMTALWPLHASRACLEMLINPYGMRTVSVRSPRADQGPADLLVEICAPCQDARYAYNVNDLLLSDFCTPAFFGETSASERYSFTGAIEYPFQVLPGGHVTWRDALSDRWWRKSYHDDLELDAELDATRPRFGAPRAVISGDTQLELPPDTVSTQLIERTNASLHLALIASQASAQRLRHQLDLPSSTPYGSQHFEMLIDMMNKDEATSATQPVVATPSVPPPLPSSPQRSASIAPQASTPAPSATQILWSLPETVTPQPVPQANASAPAAVEAAPVPTQPPPVAPTTTSMPAPSLSSFAVPSAGPRPANHQDTSASPLRTAGLVAGGALAAIGLLVIVSGARDRLLPSPRVDTPPAYASAPAPSPTPVAQPAIVAAAPVVAAPVVAAPVVAAPVVAAPVAAAPATETTSPSTSAPVDDAEAEARRARRRAKREGNADNQAQAAAPSPADPFDSLLDTRE